MDPAPRPCHYLYNAAATHQSSYSHPQSPNPPPIYPPGVDSCYSYAAAAASYEPKPASTANSHYPTTISHHQTWEDAVRHYGALPPPAVTYSTAISSLNYASTYPMDSNSVVSHPLANDAIQTISKKTKVLQSMRCEVCNVDCNSQIVFNFHLVGKKHAAQAGMIRPNKMVRANPIHSFSTNLMAHPPSNKAKEKSLKKPSIVQSAWCEVCCIDCTSQDVLKKHRMGKKHQKKLVKLGETKMLPSAPTSNSSQVTNILIIGPQEKPISNNKDTVQTRRAEKKPASGLEEDMDARIRKVVSEGAAADAVRVCAACNVVCNSQTVFSFHLAGHKHAAMMKKQAEASGTTSYATQILSVS